MACCTAEKYGGWCKDIPEAELLDVAGEKYCVFHTPKEKKGVSLDEFNKRVYARIDNAKLTTKPCDLSGTVFEGDIGFSRYNKNNPLPEIRFFEATFGKEADFSGVTFSGKANFSHATFGVEADFSHATFSKEANFWDATFSGKAYFIDATFVVEVDFLRVEFSEEAIFFSATFSEEVCFARAKFSGEAYFMGATFGGEANFSGATFSGKADFRRATFSPNFYEKASFGGAIGATFDGEADFSDAYFHGEAVFKNVKFNKDADFLETVFNEQADFHRAEFGGEAYFKGGEREIFSGLDGAGFNNVTIKDRVRFEGANLKRVSFCDTDLRRVEIISCVFIRKKSIPGYILNRVSENFVKKIEDVFYDEDILYDEFSLFGKTGGVLGNFFLRRCCSGDELSHFTKEFGEERESNIDRKELKKVERLYRRLKQRCIEDHAERSVSHWHYREKEMFKAGIPRWRRHPFLSLTSLYWLSSGYGERPFRAVGFLGFLIVAASVGMGIPGLVPFYGKSVYGIKSINGFVDIFNPHKLWALFLNTLQYVTFQKEPHFKPDSLVCASIKLFAQIFIPLQTALFALALRNRYRR